MSGNSDVSRAFYDDFLEGRMVEYRLSRNRRIERAAATVLGHVRGGSRVLEIGCGIGLVTERLARRAARVWACDLSPRNVEFARRTVGGRNVEFFVCDVLEQFDRLRNRLDGPVDTIVMVDVLEHLPADRQDVLFERLGTLLAPEATIVLTFPAAEYQRHLYAEEPDKLQPVDEIIDAARVEALAARAGARLVRFEKLDVWLTTQYAHCVLQRGGALEPVVPGPLERVRGRLGNAFLRRLVWPLRRRRFRRVLEDISTSFPADHDGSR